MTRPSKRRFKKETRRSGRRAATQGRSGRGVAKRGGATTLRIGRRWFEGRRLEWWRLKAPPLCPKCKIFCAVYSSRLDSTGARVQYRRCPRCRRSLKSSADRGR